MINFNKGSKVYTSGDYSDDEILDMVDTVPDSSEDDSEESEE